MRFIYSLAGAIRVMLEAISSRMKVQYFLLLLAWSWIEWYVCLKNGHNTFILWGLGTILDLTVTAYIIVYQIHQRNIKTSFVWIWIMGMVLIWNSLLPISPVLEKGFKGTISYAMGCAISFILYGIGGLWARVTISNLMYKYPMLTGKKGDLNVSNTTGTELSGDSDERESGGS